MHLKMKLALSARSYLSVTITAVYRSIFAGLEWHFGVFATLGTYCREHLALGPVAAISVTLCLPCFAAGGTALGLISIVFRREELLLLSAENEVCSAIRALKCLVYKTH